MNAPGVDVAWWQSGRPAARAQGARCRAAALRSAGNLYFTIPACA